MRIITALGCCLFLLSFNPVWADTLTIFTPGEDDSEVAGSLSSYIYIIVPPAKEFFISWLKTAKKEIKVAAYAFTDRDIAQTLIDLKEKDHVDVQVIMDRRQSKEPHQREIVNLLRRHSVPVYPCKSRHRQLMHCKFVVIDGRATFEGSWNLTKSANLQNNVLNFSDDPDRAQMFTKYWEKILEHGTPQQ